MLSKKSLYHKKRSWPEIQMIQKVVTSINCRYVVLKRDQSNIAKFLENKNKKREQMNGVNNRVIGLNRLMIWKIELRNHPPNIDDRRGENVWEILRNVEIQKEKRDGLQRNKWRYKSRHLPCPTQWHRWDGPLSKANDDKRPRPDIALCLLSSKHYQKSLAFLET